MVTLAPAGAALIAGILGTASGGSLSFTRVGSMSVPGAEIAAYDAATDRLLVTGDLGVTVADFEGGDPAVVRTVNPAEWCGFNTAVGASVTHVAVDPLGRGFFAVSVTPREKAEVRGQVVLVSTETLEPLCTLWVGHGPDCLAFAPDGSAIVVANEGEPQVRLVGDEEIVVDPAGSASVISLDGVASAADAATLTGGAVTTFHFDAELIAGARGLRINPRCAGDPALDLEPEYVAIAGGKALFTLQENNAVAELDLASMRWTRLTGLGVVGAVVDASDRDGAGRIDRSIAAMPCPDQMAVFEDAGRTLLLLAEEGDDRGDAGDTAVGDVARLGVMRALGKVAGRAGDGAAMRRLRVCAFSGDGDGDGVIERPTMLGTRAVSVWDAGTMTRLGSTRDEFERAVFASAPGFFNADDEGAADARSDDRGPEPEGVAVGTVHGLLYAFVTLERPGAVAALDLSSPAWPNVAGLHMSAAEGDTRPEGVVFLSKEKNATGRDLLVVCYEGSGRVVVMEVDSLIRALMAP